jgi:transposase-like protein
MVIALGITLRGEKVLLGFVQTATENERVCAAFLRELVERGLQAEPGLLVVLDGAKGLHKAVQTVFGAQALVQRCQWHKRENVVRYVPKPQQATWRRKLQAAYERPTYAEAKGALLRAAPGSKRGCGSSVSGNRGWGHREVEGARAVTRVVRRQGARRNAPLGGPR